MSFSISHFLNCFLTIVNSASPDSLSDEFLTASSSSSTNNSTSNTNSSLANVTNTASQKSANKKKNKKNQQRKQNPLMRNGKTNNEVIKTSQSISILESLDFLSLTSKTLWVQLTNEAKARYNFDLNW